MKWIFRGLGLAAMAIILFFIVRKAKKTEPEAMSRDMAYGPFVIKEETSHRKSFNMNYGMVKNTIISYAVWHDGKLVQFPNALQTNTGLAFLWRVYALPGASDPTLIAGSQSLYMIYLNDGVPVVEPIIEQGSDFASLQFLDSEAGQPGTKNEVFSKNDINDTGQLDTLQGGRYLLVSGHAVMDVQTRTIWKFSKDNNAVDNYSFPSPIGAIAFSPDRKKIVFHGAYQTWNDTSTAPPAYPHALVVYDYEKDKGYSLKYDDTATRLKNVDDINLDWFKTYFEWSNDSDTLSLKQLDVLPAWTGRYDDRDNYYYLYPVKIGMVKVFTEFVLDEMGWTEANILKDETGEYSGRRIELGSGEIKLDIGFKADEQQITFSRSLYEEDSEAYPILVKKIAMAFNAELFSGKFQEHFGKIMNE